MNDAVARYGRGGLDAAGFSRIALSALAVWLGGAMNGLVSADAVPPAVEPALVVAPAPAVDAPVDGAVFPAPAPTTGDGDEYAWDTEMLGGWPPVGPAFQPEAPVAVERPVGVTTARKRPENPQQVPGSVTVVTADTIQANGVRGVRDAAAFAPGAFVTELSARRVHFPALRGVSGEAREPAVTTFVDGVPQNNAASAGMELQGVDRIEFLRGPQGVLFGRNTPGGAIQVLTARPSLTATEGFGRVGFGTYQMADFRFGASVPLKRDELAVGFSGGASERDGYARNLVTGKEVDDRQALFGRGQVVWESGAVRARLTLAGERARDGDMALTDVAALRANPHRASHDYEGHTQRDMVSPILTVEADTEKVLVTSITSVVWWHTKEITDQDTTSTNLIVRNAQEQMSQVTQEFRFQSRQPVVRSARLTVNWLGGLSFFHATHGEDTTDQVSNAGAAALGVGFPFNDRTRVRRRDLGTAAFGQLNATWSERLHVSLGLRLDYEHKQADIATATIPATGLVRNSGSFSEDYLDLAPSLAVDYQFNSDLMGYFQLSNGHKAGGFNTTAPAGSETYQAEQVWSYELGVKSEFLNRRVTLNGAIFLIDWRNIQLLTPNTTAPGLVYLDAVGQATSQGLEVEARATAAKGWEVFAAGSVLGTRYRAGTRALGSSIGGHRLPYAPTFTWTLGSEMTQDLDEEVRAFFGFDAEFMGRYYYDAGNGVKQKEYGVVNAHAGVAGSFWRVELYARNLFDAEYIPTAFRLRPIATGSGFVGESGEPVIYGGSAEVRF